MSGFHSVAMTFIQVAKSAGATPALRTVSGGVIFRQGQSSEKRPLLQHKSGVIAFSGKRRRYVDRSTEPQVAGSSPARCSGSKSCRALYLRTFPTSGSAA